jgi:hypothetical protein
MFRTAPAAEPPADVVAADDTIPLSHLELDIDAPGNGWGAYLADKGINVVLDDLGRLSISRGDARTLFTERREAEAHAREVMARNEQAAVQRDQEWRAALPRGAAWYDVPPGVHPATAMLQAAKDAQPRRTPSQVEWLFGETDTMVYHELPAEDDAS